MSQRIPEDTIQDVLNRADIVEVIGDYVALTQRGANAKGLCPFHKEKTPSFTVSSAKGLFYCFGCQASGNVVRFLMLNENLAFPEAVRSLADRYGVQIPEAQSEPQDTEVFQLRQLHQAAAAFFTRCLGRDAEAQAVRAYCRQRQISREMVERFGIGYAPNAWEALGQEMQRQGFTQELLIRSGLVVARDNQRSGYDRFRHRLMFPITDRQGRPVAFGGRLLEAASAGQAPKYLNSPETPIFQKSRTLYGFHVAKQGIRQHRRAIIVEGYTDVIACHRQEVTHVVGTLGTALTESHVEMLKTMVKDVVLVFDGDAAGGKAAERGIGLFLDAGVRVQIVELSEGDDPDSFLQHHTGAEFLRRIEESQTFLDYLLSRARRFSDVRSPTGQADCAAHLLPLLRKIENEVERWGYVAQLAEQLGLPPDVLQRQMYPDVDWSRGAGRSRSRESGRSRDEWSRGFDRSRSTGRRSAPTRAAAATKRLPTTPGPREEYLLIQELCHEPRHVEKVVEQITAEAFQDVNLREIFTVLVRCAPQWPETAFPHILQEVADPAQGQVLTKMAMDSSDFREERAQTIQDCVARMQQRHRKEQRRRMLEQLRSNSGEIPHELLTEFRRLQHGEESRSSVG